MTTVLRPPQGPATSLPAHGQPLVDYDSDDAEGTARRQRRERRIAFFWLGAFALFFLCNAAAVVCRVRDPWEVTFATGVAINVLFLFGALATGWPNNSLTDGSRRQRRALRSAIWSLATLLNFGFSFRAAAVVPTAVSLVIWSLEALITYAGLWLLVLERCDDPGAVTGESSNGSRVEEKV